MANLFNFETNSPGLKSFCSEYFLNKDNKKILMSEYIKLSKDFLTQEEVKYFNYLLDDASKKAP